MRLLITEGDRAGPFRRLASDTSSALGLARRCRTVSEAFSSFGISWSIRRPPKVAIALVWQRKFPGPRLRNGSQGSARSASRRTRRFLAMLIWYLLRLNIPVAWGARQQSCSSYRTTRSSHPTKPARCPLSTIQAAWDEVLIARIAQGHQLSSPCRYRRHHVRVHRFGPRLVRDQQVAEDLVTEIFLNLWRQASKV